MKALKRSDSENRVYKKLEAGMMLAEMLRRHHGDATMLSSQAAGESCNGGYELLEIKARMRAFHHMSKEAV